MNKYFIFLLMAVSLLVSLAFNENTAAHQNLSSINNPVPTPKSRARIEKIELDRNEVIIPCPPTPGWSQSDFSPCFDAYNGLIKVKITVSNPKNRKLSYKYSVSGGRITGQGESITWDLTGVRPGDYTITAAIDGCKTCNESKTEEIRIRECDCPLICICPTLTISGGGNVKAGETVSFKADVSGGTAGEISYNWIVSEGEIIAGQGTPEITVKTTDKMAGQIIKATVEIGGPGLCAECPREASETASIVR